MKVILVNGSPNKNGCTYTALCEVEKTLNEQGIETEIFWIKTKPIIGCNACMKCGEKGECTFDNDVVNEFVKKAYDADAFVFGSPVYYAGANGSLISFLDRAFYSNSHGDAGKAFKHKPGAVICSARRAGTTSTYDQLIKYLGISQMPIIS
ncbi:MAG: flavodoxin family protein, partial [Methanobrevibacter sp.]|nr:flavodoxin family protein [Methanobrevibacter sp.]